MSFDDLQLGQMEEDNLNPHESMQSQRIDGIPPLPLDLHEHKLKIALNWAFIILTSCIAPLVLYPSLHWGANLSLNISLAVASAILGVSTLFSLSTRTWHLLKHTSECRPINSTSRWNLDFFHWNFLLGFVLVTIVLVIGMAQEPPSVKMTALPPSLLITQVGFTLVVSGVLAKLRVRQPFPVSSVPAGAVFRPGVLVIIEDVVAVDGGRGRVYRSALMERYTASLRFQRLIGDLNWFWGLSGFILGVILLSVLSSVHDETFAFGLGWTIPWIWAGIWSIITTYWVKAALRDEKRQWHYSQTASNL